MAITKGDFIEMNYTGRLVDGKVFDTTEKEVAVANGMPLENGHFHPSRICVGEQQVLKGLDDELVGKEVGAEFTVTLEPENAFGKRDIKKMRIVPMSTFKEHNVKPQPGLQIDVDGQMGIVSRVSGGRVIVNFNHPLAGKQVTYKVKILSIIEDPVRKIKAFMHSATHVPEDKVEVTIKEKKAEVKMPFDFPAQVAMPLSKKLSELTGLDVSFLMKEPN